MKSGATWGYRIVAVTGLSEPVVYQALRQLVDDGLIEAVEGGTPAPPHRIEYRPASA